MSMPMFVARSRLSTLPDRPQTGTTTRVCAERDCDAPGSHIKGRYTYLARQVRVWVCEAHAPAVPSILPLPASLQAALADEAAFQADLQRKLKFVRPERDESVRTLSPAGHGDPIPRDRVKSWRWGS